MSVSINFQWLIGIKMPSVSINSLTKREKQHNLQYLVKFKIS